MRAAWHQAMDMQLDTHSWNIEPYGIQYLESYFNYYGEGRFDRKHFDSVDEELRNTIVHYARTVYRGDTIFVTRDMQNILMQAVHDMPDDLVFEHRMVFSPMAFCVFEEPMLGVDRAGKATVVSGMSWELANVFTNPDDDETTKVAMVYFMSNPYDWREYANEDFCKVMQDNGMRIPPLLLSHHFPLNHGELLPQTQEDIPGTELVSNVVKMFVAMQLLAQQKIGEPMKLPVPRASRKRHKDYFVDGMKYISLITLRKKSVTREDHDPEKREYSHRFVVRGHWRRQYYPSTKTHDWKYIYEHIKGPEDKPLLIKERRVFNFAR